MYRDDGVGDSRLSRSYLLLSQVGARSDVIKGAAARGIPAQAGSLSCTPYLEKLHTTNCLLCLLQHDQPFLGYSTISASLIHGTLSVMLTKAAKPESGCNEANAAKA